MDETQRPTKKRISGGCSLHFHVGCSLHFHVGCSLHFQVGCPLIYIFRWALVTFVSSSPPSDYNSPHQNTPLTPVDIHKTVHHTPNKWNLFLGPPKEENQGAFGLWPTLPEPMSDIVGSSHPLDNSSPLQKQPPSLLIIYKKKTSYPP